MELKVESERGYCKEVVSGLAHALISKKTKIINAAISSYLGDEYWSPSDMMDKVDIICQCHKGNFTETVIFDSKPILKIYPPEYSQHSEQLSVKVTATVKYERL